MVLANETRRSTHDASSTVDTTKIAGVVAALNERFGRREEIAAAVRGDEIDRNLMIKNICEWDIRFVPLERAVKKTGLSWKDAVTAAINHCVKLHQEEVPLSVG